MLWHSFGTEPSAAMPTSQVMSISSYTVCEHQFATSVTRRKYQICDGIFDESRWDMCDLQQIWQIKDFANTRPYRVGYARHRSPYPGLDVILICST